jgi:hypothetical protein
MAVVALRTIEKGEEVLTSYIDVALPREERKRDLKERYKFECGCEGCKGLELDPREALECSTKGCEGLIALPRMSLLSLISGRLNASFRREDLTLLFRQLETPRPFLRPSPAANAVLPSHTRTSTRPLTPL